MTWEPKTGREALMKLDMEQTRIEARDRAVAVSVASEAIDKHFKPEDIEDMRDVRRMITYAAEWAAYMAIQKERELHLGDMAALKAWMEVRASEAMLKPLPLVVPRKIITREELAEMFPPSPSATPEQ